MGGFPSGPDPYLVYGLPWLAVSSNRLFFKNGRRLKWFKLLFWFKLFRPRWPGFAAQGARVGGRVDDSWDFVVLGSGKGYGICRWFGQISEKMNPCFVGRSPFLKFFFEFKGGLESGWISDRVQPAFRLWVALVGSFVDSAFLQKRPAIKDSNCLVFFFDFKGGVENGWIS